MKHKIGFAMYEAIQTDEDELGMLYKKIYENQREGSHNSAELILDTVVTVVMWWGKFCCYLFQKYG
ncbi:hypothetical protein LQZ18_07035 [Lachnospiraceae bacterium ZAX-1]